MSVTAVILAGGKSSRMGQDKGLMDFKGKPLVEHVAEVCQKLTSRIFISTNNPAYNFLGYKLIPDDYKNMGPIAGIQSALSGSKNNDVIFCPCDMPYLKVEIFEKILQKKRENLAVAVIGPDGKIFPVPGYYSKNALPVIERQIEKGNYKLLDLLKELDAETVLISDSKALLNMNYPKDLK